MTEIGRAAAGTAVDDASPAEHRAPTRQEVVLVTGCSNKPSVTRPRIGGALTRRVSRTGRSGVPPVTRPEQAAV